MQIFYCQQLIPLTLKNEEEREEGWQEEKKEQWSWWQFGRHWLLGSRSGEIKLKRNEFISDSIT